MEKIFAAKLLKEYCKTVSKWSDEAVLNNIGWLKTYLRTPLDSLCKPEIPITHPEKLRTALDIALKYVPEKHWGQGETHPNEDYQKIIDLIK